MLHLTCAIITILLAVASYLGVHWLYGRIVGETMDRPARFAMEVVSTMALLSVILTGATLIERFIK